MARNDGRLEKGQRLSGAISARAWNRAQDAADRVLGTRPGFAADGPGGTSAPYTWVYAKNASGATVNRWGVLAITGVEITPTTSSGGATAEFEAMPVLTAGAISGNETKERCVAIEPIESNKVGMVAIAGAVQVQAADVSKLPTATVLWQDTNWAFVRFGGGSTIRVGRTTAPWPVGTCLPIGVYETVPSGSCIPTGCVQESGGGEQSGVPGSVCNPDSTITDVANLSHYVETNSWVIIGKAANGRWYLIEAVQETTRLGSISASWSKGTTATVTKLNEDGSATTVTFTAKNWFADVTVSSGTKKVACSLVGNTWILIAAEC